jgi:hypothetical protein
MVPANGASGERQSTMPTGYDDLQLHRIVPSNSRVSRAGVPNQKPEP